jgi:hypothetical protein
MNTRTKPPTWFWIVGVILLLWGLIGFGGFVADRMMSPSQLAQMSDYDRRLYTERPGWTIWAYGIATATGLLGAVLLLVRRGLARPLWIVSLVFVVLLFGYMLTATDLIAAKGFLGAAGFPIVIALIGVAQIWFSGVALRRGWIG